MTRWFSGFVALLALGIMLMSCANSSTRDELELTTSDLAQDHQKVALYYRHEARRLRQASEEQSARSVLYEQLFGPTSDWVAGARLLAESYKEAANEQERKAREHLNLMSEKQSTTPPQSP